MSADRMMKAVTHGAWVTATGDTTRLERMRTQASKRDRVAEAWAKVGEAMQQSIDSTPKPRRAK